MSVNVKALLLDKNARKNTGKKVVLKDVNRALMVSLFAISVYGKEARDEEILSVIINAGADADDVLLKKIRDNYNALIAEKKVKKTKSGVRDTDGFLLLVPRA